MILFHELRYKNLLTAGNTFTTIRLDKHKDTLIVGRNGHGKSSVIDALVFGLFNRPHRDINKGQLINSINKKNLLVEVDFTIGKNTYTVRRGLKPNIFEIICNGNLINQSADSRDYQEYLEKNILKLNYKTFLQVVILSTTSYKPFMKLSQSERREVIEDLLDIEIFSKMNIILKNRIQDNKQQLSEIDNKILFIKEKIKINTRHIEKAREDREQLIQIANSYISTYQKNIDIKEIQISVDTKKLEELKRLVVDSNKISNKITQLNKVDVELKLKHDRLKEELNFFENHDNCPVCKQKIDDAFKNTTIHSKKNNIKTVEDGIIQLHRECDMAVKKYQETQKILQEIQNIEATIKDANSNISMNKNLIERYRKDIEAYKTQQKADIDSDIIEQLNKELREYETVKNKLGNEKVTYDVVSSLLKDTGIKSKIIKQYIPVLNKLINKYLSAMDFFVNFELNENFEETIKSRHRDTFSYASFSEGQKMRLNLAMIFAWRSIAKIKNNANVNILFFDETLDGSLDSSGVDDFLKIINSILNETNVFIISHKNETIDRFTNIIRFELTKNFSKAIQ